MISIKEKNTSFQKYPLHSFWNKEFVKTIKPEEYYKRNKEEIEGLNKLIFSDLEYGKENMSKSEEQSVVILFDTQGFKYTGKTKVLIDFAKQYDYSVIESEYNDITKLRKQYNYTQIYKENEYKPKQKESIVISENVNLKNLISIIKGYDVDIITGFINEDYYKDKISNK